MTDLKRLSFLDSYRAIAITAVALFHYFALWAPPLKQVSAYPYGERFSHVFLFRFGYFGVELFFLISGFVITLTMQSCDSFYEYGVKRFVRLCPALVFCTLILYVLTATVGTLPALTPHLADLLPSLTTIGPRFFQALGIKSEYLIGSVWSLFVEIRFYLIAGVIYFSISRTRFVLALLSFSVVGMGLALLHGRLDGGVGQILTSLMLVRHIGWLALGAYCYKLHQGTDTPMERMLALVNWIGVTAIYWFYPEPLSPQLPSAALAFLLPGVFALSCVSPLMQQALSQAWLVRVGAASYSLYLIHEVIGVALISHISPNVPLALQLVMVCAIYAGMIALSIMVYALIETPGREVFRKLLLREPQVETARREIYESS